MEPMNTPQSTGIMVKFRERRGFSLIEIAIVLVIIGIIIGAIIKGQDLITNSRAKQVVATMQSWNNLAHGFFDRNGRWPGDAGKNGVIGDQTAATGGEEQAAAINTAMSEIETTMQVVPANPFVVSGMSFWVYYGNVAGNPSGKRNVMLICGAADCVTAFTAEQLEMIKAIDTAVDGTADGGLGQFRAMTNAGALANPAAGNTAGGRATAGFNALGAAVSTTAAGTATPWAAANTTAVWAFDRPF